MRNISIFQILILVLVSLLIFTDFSKIKKKVIGLIKNVQDKNRKKGS